MVLAGVGIGVGGSVGAGEGIGVGDTVGLGLGIGDGTTVGTGDGEGVGQGSSLQDWISSRGGHWAPVPIGEISTTLVRLCVPPPQVTLQSHQGASGASLQSTGQTSILQALCSVRSAQAAPTPTWGTATVRTLLCDPPPHVTLHAAQSFHGSTVQSTGQISPQ